MNTAKARIWYMPRLNSLSGSELRTTRRVAPTAKTQKNAMPTMVAARVPGETLYRRITYVLLPNVALQLIVIALNII
jgi:hypothetical protein